jgi:murein DD-endopeptidase MepM/ murein hydrolase activator NlpD
MQRRRAIALALGGVASLSLIAGCALPPECTPRMTADQCAQAVGQAAAEKVARSAAEEAQRIADEAVAAGKRKAEEIQKDPWSYVPKVGGLGSSLTFNGAPVPLDRVTWFNWYGATALAHGELRDAYGELQGLHSGVDFLVPIGTPIVSRVTIPGTVLSVDNEQYGYKAGPSNVLVDHGTYLVLYGHTQRGSTPKIDTTINPGDPVASSGSNEAGVAHLHLEVIERYADWTKPAPGQKATRKPGDIRINPVPLFSAELRKQIDDPKVPKGALFYPPEHEWGKPEKQPRITPGGKSFW